MSVWRGTCRTAKLLGMVFPIEGKCARVLCSFLHADNAIPSRCRPCYWPAGSITSTANQARTRTFSLDDPTNVRYAADVVTFAQKVGLYPTDAPADKFSFSDVYDPVSFGGARLAEARVWNIFNSVTNGAFAPYLDYAQGYNLTNRMPLMAQVHYTAAPPTGHRVL